MTKFFPYFSRLRRNPDCILASKSKVLMRQRRWSASFTCGSSLEAMVYDTHQTTA